MGVEIERKYLVRDDAWRAAVASREHIAQGYLVGAAALRAGMARASVRVRVAGDGAWINVKSSVPGVVRAEYDVPMPPAEAQVLLETLCDGVLEKTRYRVPVEDVVFEIDEFLGANQGLIVAEVELRDALQTVPKPAWLGREVSQLARYYNVNLIGHPFTSWTAEERAGC